MSLAKGRQPRDFSYKDLLRVHFPTAFCIKRISGSVRGYVLFLNKNRAVKMWSASTAEECWIKACENMNIDIDDLRPEIQDWLRAKKAGVAVEFLERLRKEYSE